MPYHNRPREFTFDFMLEYDNGVATIRAPINVAAAYYPGTAPSSPPYYSGGEPPYPAEVEIVGIAAMPPDNYRRIPEAEREDQIYEAAARIGTRLYLAGEI